MTDPKFPPMPTTLSRPPVIPSGRPRPTCATCRFMAEPRGLEIFGDTEAEDTVTEHRSCVRVIHGNHDCSRESLSKSAREPALVIDGSGYAARLIVLPTFGCALHEAKP